MKQIFLLFAALFFVSPANAQFDFNKLLDTAKKISSVAKQTSEATKEFSEAEEIELGEGIASQFLGAVKLHSDQNLQRYVNRVGRWIASQSERSDLPWTFGVLDSEQINAFALPGGIVLVSSGLMKHLASEAELAGVLAHEIGHVVKKHQLNAMQADKKGSLLQIGAESLAATRIAKTNAGSSALGSQLAGAAANAGISAVKDGLFLRPLDKSLEYEADKIGVVLAARAGYDAYGLIAVLQTLSNLKTEESGVSLLMSTHPTPLDRMSDLEKFSVTLDKYSTQPQVAERYQPILNSLQ